MRAAIDPRDRFFVAGLALLLVPLGLFWLSVVTGSEGLTRFLFGSEHRPLRDLIPVFAAAGAFAWCAWRLLRGPVPVGPARSVARAVLGLTAASLAVMFVYLVLENAGHVRSAAGG